MGNLTLPQPTVIDRVFEAVAPVYAARRMQARAGMAMYRQLYGGGYVAGRSDSTEMQEYAPWPGSAGEDINPGLVAMRARARDLARNAPIATGAENTAVTGVIGSGLAAKPGPDREFLGLSDREADAWESRARKLWELWAESTRCDIESELNFYDLQELAFRNVLASGDVLVVHRWMEGDSLLQTRVQLIEADRVSNPLHLQDTDRMVQGVETDELGRTVRYHVQEGHPGDLRVVIGPTPYRWLSVSPYWPNGDRRAWLLYHKRRIGQRRGVPYLAPVIAPLKQLERYTTSELMAALISSMFTVFVKTENPGSGSGLPGLEGSGTPERAGQLRLGHGLVTELLDGEEIETANPGRPNAQFDPFVQAILRQTGVALEIPYEILTKHFSSSYSASRAALLEAWRFFRHRREWVASHFCDPAYAAVISEGVASGLLDAPGFFDDPLVRSAWLGVQWAGDSMPQLDPMKEVNAAAKRVEEGFSTRERESMELTGTDYEQNHAQREKEERMRREAGLVPATVEAA